MDRITLYKLIDNKINVKLPSVFQNGYQIERKDFDVTDIHNSNPYYCLVLNLPLHRMVEMFFWQQGAISEVNNFSIIIYNTKNINNDIGKSPHFSLMNYYYNKTNSRKGFSLNDYEGAINEKIDKMLSFVFKIIINDLFDVFSGKTWINVPWDWCGAK